MLQFSGDLVTLVFHSELPYLISYSTMLLLHHSMVLLMMSYPRMVVPARDSARSCHGNNRFAAPYYAHRIPISSGV